MLAVTSRPAEAVCVRRALETLSALVSATALRRRGVGRLSQRPRMLTISFGESEASWTGRLARAAARRRRRSAFHGGDLIDRPPRRQRHRLRSVTTGSAAEAS